MYGSSPFGDHPCMDVHLGLDLRRRVCVVCLSSAGLGRGVSGSHVSRERVAATPVLKSIASEVEC